MAIFFKTPNSPGASDARTTAQRGNDARPACRWAFGDSGRPVGAWGKGSSTRREA